MHVDTRVGTRSIPALQALGRISLLRISQDSLVSITRQIVVYSELLHTEDSGARTLSYKNARARTHAHTPQCHYRNAAFLYRQFVSLEGLWVKLGQFLSSRADVMPAAYVEVS